MLPSGIISFRNGDAHLKNWSLIYPDRRRARLSPAYDLVCTAVHLPDPGNPLLVLPFLGAIRLADVGRGHFARLRDRLRVGDEDVLDVVDETCERFRGLWADGAAAEYRSTFALITTFLPCTFSYRL